MQGLYCLRFIQSIKWIATFIIYLSCLILIACSSGGDGGSTEIPPPPPPGNGSLSGIIKQSNSSALPGAIITLPSVNRSAITDLNGKFFIPDIKAGKYMVSIDATTATGSAGTAYGKLVVLATVEAEKESGLDQVIFLPDLNNPLTASANVTVTNGISDAAISALNGNISVSSGVNVNIKIDGVDAVASVDVAATPVPLSQLPMVLDSGEANVASFVTIQPPNATFSPALDLTIPNDQGLAPGTMVNIWSFDHDIEDWVNRSAQTGNKGVVSEDGSVIEATEVITKGGWHGPTGAPLSTTTVIGVIEDSNGAPLAGVYIFTNSGQLGTSEADGSFTINNVTIDPVMLAITTPVSLGGVTTTTSMAAVNGGTTDFGTIALIIPDTGNLSGRALAITGPSTNFVTITGVGSTLVVNPAADGTFFLSDLAPGSYTASTTFSGSNVTGNIDFTITIGSTTFISLQQPANTGGGIGPNKIMVKTFIVDNDLENSLIANNTDRIAQISVQQGTTTLYQSTNAQGLAEFNLDNGTFSVTAQHDVERLEITGTSTMRVGTTIFFDNPPASGQVGIFLIGTFGDGIPGNPTATITGSVSNIPDLLAGYDLVVHADFPNGSQQYSQTLLSGPLAAPTIPTDYTMPNVVPGDYKIYAEIVKSTNTSNATTGEFVTQNEYATAAILMNPLTVAPNATSIATTLDFSNAGMAVSFANKNVTVNNISSEISLIPPALGNSERVYYQIDSTLLAANGNEFIFRPFFTNSVGIIPSTASMVTGFPSSIASNSADFSADGDKFNTQLLNILDSLSQDDSIAVPAGLDMTFNLINLPSITQPPSTSVEFTPTQLSTLNLAWDGNAASQFNSIIVSAFDNPATTPVESGVTGIDVSFWIMYIPGNMKSIAMPATALTIFGVDGAYNISIGESTVRNTTVNFEEIFNHNVVTNLDNSFVFYGASAQRSINLIGVVP